MMKLVDILAREMKVFPSSTDVVGQAKDGTLHLGYSHKPINGWTLEKYTMASDWEVAHVTHTEWKSAVDALNTPKPAEWTVDGLPPVGADVEFIHSGVEDWVRCHVVGYYKGHLYGQTDHPEWQNNDGCCHLQLDEGLPTAIKFRPIRTAEQIAADQREKEAEDLAEVMTGHRDRSGDCYLTLAKVILDAGYRKQVTP